MMYAFKCQVLFRIATHSSMAAAASVWLVGRITGRVGRAVDSICVDAALASHIFVAIGLIFVLILPEKNTQSEQILLGLGIVLEIYTIFAVFLCEPLKKKKPGKDTSLVSEIFRNTYSATRFFCLLSTILMFLDLLLTFPWVLNFLTTASKGYSRFIKYMHGGSNNTTIDLSGYQYLLEA